ncbi:hypothetical protein KCP73_26350 [Salmonella enterica subsp. enterica]|nr:hypothetical protein KCP73_26350 [Salmonella enterica subsp. enterica]
MKGGHDPRAESRINWQRPVSGSEPGWSPVAHDITLFARGYSSDKLSHPGFQLAAESYYGLDQCHLPSALNPS